MPARARGFQLLFLVLALAAIAVLTRSLWLPWFGYALIHDDGPSKAELAVVLAGDYSGNRLAAAADLVKDGEVPVVLVSGPPYYGVYECDLAIDMMVKRGYPAAWFERFPHHALSTKEEAAAVFAELKRRGVHNFILVTSNYHTGRARRIFHSVERKLGGGPEFRVLSANDPNFQPGSWWHNREAEKIVFMEWWKNLAAAVGN